VLLLAALQEDSFDSSCTLNDPCNAGMIAFYTPCRHGAWGYLIPGTAGKIGLQEGVRELSLVAHMKRT